MSKKLNPGELTVAQARREMLSILSRIPTSLLPKPSKIEKEIDNPDGVAWFGSTGWHIRPGTGRADMDSRFRTEIDDALAQEWLRRERVRRYGDGWVFRNGEQVSS